MLKNYLKITLRNIKRNPAFSVINIAGLAIGMACCILIVNYIVFESSYDRFHERGDRIYRLFFDYTSPNGERFSGAIGPYRLQDELKSFNEVGGPVFKIKNDPRITKIGRLLRKSSIDEIPQLINVLKGDMSIVDFRPKRPVFIDKFKQEIPLYMKEHLT